MSAFLRIAAWILAVALVVLPVVAVLEGWIGAERWPLRTLRIGGDLHRVDEQKLRAAVLPYARKGFFAVRLEDAQAAVAKLPWVERAEVRKRWPDVVEVRIVEHRPFARWGQDQLLSEDGDLFPLAGAEVPRGLPRFDVDAPAARTADVVALYNEASAMFAPEGVRVSEVSLDRRGSWSLLLSNGIQVVVGSQEARLRLARFARLLPNLLARNPLPLARADLRYTNGFALTWGEEPGSGIRNDQPAAVEERAGLGEGHARLSVADPAPVRRTPWFHAAFPNPESPIPNPGTTT
ncbi:cell division protein FtsQ/DivIB [Luteimonas mephitis]|uniref:cell division protein FtsQ/DivIB n=1 Tax=Luteimonas mephitis TaxID=83615 RepID=UPI003A926EEC